MAFKTYSTGKTSRADFVQVDFDEINKYVVETAALQERETLIGYISGIVDLGEQDQPDAEFEFDGDEEDEAAEIEKNPAVYFKDGFNETTRKPVRLKCFPVSPVQSVGIAVDFPEIVIDKGQFYGNSNPKPLRLWMGGQFYTPNKGMVIGRTTPLRVTNLDKTRATKKWSFAQNHLFYKMAVDAKLIKNGEAFLPQDIDQLLGQSFQFQVQVYFKEAKGGKSYYTEWIKYQGALARKDEPWVPEDKPFLIEFDGNLTKEVMQNLRSHVINTIKSANNYEGSKIQDYFENNETDSGSGSNSQDTPDEPEAKPVSEKTRRESRATPARKMPAKVSNTGFDDMDDDIPFK